MIFQLLWKNEKLNWPNRARTVSDLHVLTERTVKSWREKTLPKSLYFDLVRNINNLFLAENKENFPCNNYFFCLAILLFNSNQDNASNPSGI